MSAPESASGRRWLITGAGGQLGRSMQMICGARGVDVVGLTHEELDVTDPVAVSHALASVRPDVLLNCAALTHVDGCEERAEGAEELNARAPEILARAALGKAVLVQMSTDYVFAGDGNVPIDEEARPGPRSVYGRSKLAGEEAVRAAGGEHLIVRTQWVFGPGRNFVQTILAEGRKGEELRVVEDQYGRPTWSGALAAGLLGALDSGARGTLHLACEGVASWYDLALAVADEGVRRKLLPRIAIRPIATSEMPRPAARPVYAVLGLDRARRLGIVLPHWRDALTAYLDAEREGRDG